MKFNVRAKPTAVVAVAVFMFGVALPLLSDATITGASGTKLPVGQKSTVGSKSPVKTPVTTTTVPLKKASGTKAPGTTTTVKSAAHTLTVRVTFAAPSAALSAAAKSQLAGVARKIVKGATVTIWGYSKQRLSLSSGRTKAVESYLKSQSTVTFRVKLIAAHASKNQAVVRVLQP